MDTCLLRPFAAVLLCCGATTASAQLADVPSGALSATAISPIAPVVTGACVLHVWPSAKARSSFTGWFNGGAVDGDRRGYKGYPTTHANRLDAAAQRQLLQGINWGEARQIPGLAVVVHDAPPEAQDNRMRRTPLVADAPACYHEVLVHSVLIEGAPMSSTTLRLMIIAKKWNPGELPSTYSAMSTAKVDLKQPSTAEVEVALKAAFAQAIVSYLRDEQTNRR